MPSEPNTRALRLGGHTWREHLFGAPGGRAWLALHGFTGSGADFEALAPEVGGRWVALDLPGHGGTAALPGEDWTRRVVEAVAERARAEPTRPRLLGYSMGGRTALRAALCAPEAFSRVVLIGTTAGIEGDAERAARRGWDEDWARRAESSAAEEFLEAWYALPLLASQAAIAAPLRSRMLARRHAHDPRGWAASLRGMGSGVMAPVGSRLGALELPVLLITGEADTRYTALAERLVEALPDAQRVVIPGVGHSPHLEAPRAVAEALRGL